MNLYIANTKDEYWLKERQKQDKPPIWIKSLDQINDEYTNVEFEDDDLESSNSEENFL